jgi:hypothetical protein
MSSELELLKQRITELEAKNAKLEAEKAEIEARNAELLKQVMEKDAKRDAENAKLRAGIEELKYENAGLRDRITKVEQNQLQNDSAEGTQGKRNNTPNNNSSNFNSGAVPEAITVPTNSAKRLNGKSLEEKEMDNFLLEADKKIVSDGIRQCNREKKLKKAEQASLNQDQESDSGLNVDNRTSSGTSLENFVSEKDGKRLIQEISRNLDSPEISFTPGKENHVTEISFTPRKENILY